jgi:hypothetical protein
MGAGQSFPGGCRTSAVSGVFAVDRIDIPGLSTRRRIIRFGVEGSKNISRQRRNGIENFVILFNSTAGRQEKRKYH